jgi:hypothetical protein
MIAIRSVTIVLKSGMSITLLPDNRPKRRR